MPSSTPPSFQIMKIRIFLLLLSPLWLFSSEVSNKSSGGKTVPESVKFKTSEEYDSEAAARIAGFTLPDDVKASLFADPGQTQNPSAICFDSKGNLYVAEIHRWRAGVQDIRNEQQILLDDINNETNEDRLEMYQRDTKRPVTFYTDYEDRIVLLRDSDSDGRADDSPIFSGSVPRITVLISVATATSMPFLRISMPLPREGCDIPALVPALRYVRRRGQRSSPESFRLRRAQSTCVR